jgi:glycosyltransferase involved in cell wall biosynthesis
VPAITLVVPCYNEAGRLDDNAFLSLVRGGSAIQLLFVNDGSEDTTADRLSALQANETGAITVLMLEHNRGKAEAVRQGLLRALASGAPIVGYQDADLATPVAEVDRLCRMFRADTRSVLLASRVLLLGRDIRRRAVRHYTGRVFATFASVVLRLKVYDTQCGTKLFRATPQLAAALAEPFLSRWIFDVELLGRLVVGSSKTPPVDLNDIVEEPLLAWYDVPGSKLRTWDAAGAIRDMVRVAYDLSRRRNGRDKALAGAGHQGAAQ